MKKRLFFWLLSLSLYQVAYSQGGVVTPSQNVNLIETFTGSLSELKAYSNGVLYIANDGTDDFVTYSLDGSAFATSESLVLSSGNRLSSWAGDSQAFYYGNNVSDGVGDKLRSLTSGASSLLLDSSDPTVAVTEVFRVDYGSGDVKYYFMAEGPTDGFGNIEAIINESNGIDETWEVDPELDPDSFVPGTRMQIKMSYANSAGQMSGTVSNGAFYFLADSPGGNGNYSSIFKVNYDPNYSEVELVVNSGSEVADWDNLIVTDDYYYVCMTSSSGEALSMNYIDKLNTDVINEVTDILFHSDKPLQSNNRIYGVGEEWINGAKNKFRKLVIVDEQNVATLIHLNAVTEDDQVSNLVLSGNKIFFTATPTGGSQGIYAVRTDVSNPVPVLVEDLAGKEFKGMVEVPDGVAYAMWDGLSGNVVISQGFKDADYWLHRGADNGNYAWGEITDLVVNGNTLFVAEKASNGTDVNIWSNDLTATEFSIANARFTITDSESQAVIEGASLSLDNGLETYVLSTDAAGQDVVLNIPSGWYNYILSANGYKTVSDGRVWIGAGSSEKSLTMEVDNSTNISDKDLDEVMVYPNPAHDIINIKAIKTVVAVRIYSLTGQCVKTVEASDINTINVSDLQNGMYVMVINYFDSGSSTFKITKK
ncbi:T9SS type A sorting domain-containing protein [Carboxylicivirga sp. M1479]|uniref:T9SS type A sorting domain-containing protein n=1 Tax=Carboxylicivirga sp. M1479 TaxID=2594476 RepID=UPI00117825A0|nr:T9SS type A sorting domain-containing protein [Carboxylicivirga sp. M1479]TRX71801.1 T9SS type A sorting domain-containing protein [Carboxylicivirga sp. M1479]